jgi:hypothetical protein
MLIAVVLAAPADAALIAAYETHRPGSGFDIAMVDLATGRPIPVPAGVNTPADELHPALTPDGRWLIVVRPRPLAPPQPDGTPATAVLRSLVVADLRTGATRFLTSSSGGAPAGPAIVAGAGGTYVSAGMRTAPGDLAPAGVTWRLVGEEFVVEDVPLGIGRQDDPRFVVDHPHHAYVRLVGDGQRWASGRLLLDAGTGAQLRPPEVTVLWGLGRDQFTVLGGSGAVAVDHPSMRSGDGHVAVAMTFSAPLGLQVRGADIWSAQIPGDAVPRRAPDAINTRADERMPAWTPDGAGLVFVRTTPRPAALPLGAAFTPRRTLLRYDLTPGVQALVGPPLDLGPVAPTPELQRFQETYGGISVAEVREPARVRVDLSGLAPRVSGPIPGGARLDGLVVRAGAPRTVLGRRLPRVVPVGRVALGAARRERRGRAWDGRVRGDALSPGRYLLTVRLRTTAGRVLASAPAIPFRVGRDGVPTPSMTTPED